MAALDFSLVFGFAALDGDLAAVFLDLVSAADFLVAAADFGEAALALATPALALGAVFEVLLADAPAFFAALSD